MSAKWTTFGEFLFGQRRSKKFLNILFGIMLFVLLFIDFCICFMMICENVQSDYNQILVECTKDKLITDVDSFKIPDGAKQEIHIRNLIWSVAPGETITLTVSDITNELLEVKYSGNTVYKKEKMSLFVNIFFMCLLTLPLIVSTIIILIAVNAKNPKRWLRKIQRRYVLMFYK